MEATTASDRHWRQLVPSRWPILAPLALFAIALLFRAVDIFALRLDERLGEIILSKSLGFALVVGYTWWVGEHLAALGIHSRRLLAALSIGGGVTSWRS